MTDEPLFRPLWGPFMQGLPVDGGSICVISRSGLSSTVGTSDALAEELDALQLELGEGPRWRAFRSGAPVLIPDAADSTAHVDWPLLGVALAATPVRGVFSFPLVIGLLIVGVADLYTRTTSEPWSEQLVAEATAIAAACAGPAVRLATRSATSERQVSPVNTAELRREVHQATGMLIVRLNLRPEAALARLEAYAFAAGRPLLEVARDVIGRRLDLDAQHG